jgi:hypothetical protein
MRHAVESDTSFYMANCRTDSVLERRPYSHEWFHQCQACEHLACSRLFSCRQHSQLLETTPPTSSRYSLHLYWFLNRRWTVTIEFVCRNHSTIRVFCSIVSGWAFLNDVTAATIAKYGKNRLMMHDDYGATTYIELCTFCIVYRSTKIDNNWLKDPVYSVINYFITEWHCFRSAQFADINSCTAQLHVHHLPRYIPWDKPCSKLYALATWSSYHLYTTVTVKDQNLKKPGRAKHQSRNSISLVRFNVWKCLIKVSNTRDIIGQHWWK